jgi:hypothetical protein
MTRKRPRSAYQTQGQQADSVNESRLDIGETYEVDLRRMEKLLFGICTCCRIYKTAGEK